jgi:hypothetical protein
MLVGIGAIQLPLYQEMGMRFSIYVVGTVLGIEEQRRLYIEVVTPRTPLLHGAVQ